jgi:hypothetical protein
MQVEDILVLENPVVPSIHSTHSIHSFKNLIMVFLNILLHRVPLEIIPALYNHSRHLWGEYTREHPTVVVTPA